MSFEQEKRRGRTSFILAASFLGAVLVAGVAVGIFLTVRGNNTADPGQPAPTPTATTSADTSADTTDGACGPVPHETTNTLTSAPQTTWEPWSATIIATSPEAGPEKDADGVRTCYSRTATGALLAAYNSTQYCADSTVFADAMGAVVASGPGREAAVNKAKTAAPCPASGPYVTAYKITSYDGQTATVYLALDAPSGQAAVGLQMKWEDGDWKAILDATGNVTVAPSPLTSTNGYTPWGPTNG